MNPLTLDDAGNIHAENIILKSWKFHFLSYPIELDGLFTFRSLFQMMERYAELTLLNPFWQNLMDDYRKCSGGLCVTDRCDFFELAKSVEMIGFPGSPRVEIYSNLDGRCAEDKKERLSVRDFKMDELLDMRIRLGKLRHVIFGDRVDAFEYDTPYILFEFIECVSWELSFQGTSRHCQWGE